MTNYVEQSLSREVDYLVAVLFSNLTVEIVAPPPSHTQERENYISSMSGGSLFYLQPHVCAVVASYLHNTFNKISLFF